MSTAYPLCNLKEYFYTYIYTYEAAVVWRVVCWLIRRKAWVRNPSQPYNEIYKKYFFGDFHEKFLKNLSFEANITHNINVVRSLAVILTEGL